MKIFFLITIVNDRLQTVISIQVYNQIKFEFTKNGKRQYLWVVFTNYVIVISPFQEVLYIV